MAALAGGRTFPAAPAHVAVAGFHGHYSSGGAAMTCRPWIAALPWVWTTLSAPQDPSSRAALHPATYPASAAEAGFLRIPGVCHRPDFAHPCASTLTFKVF